MDELKQLRSQIDNIDSQIITLLAARMDVSRNVGKLKKGSKLAPLDTLRWQKVLSTRIKQAEKAGLDPAIIQEIWEIIHKYSLKIQEHEIS